MRYLCDPHVIPTVVPEDLGDITLATRAAAEYAEALHIDIADGVFAPNTTWPFIDPSQRDELRAFRSLVAAPEAFSFAAHLMVADPRALALELARAGFSRLTMHLESFEKGEAAREALDSVRAAGAKEAGLALKIDTPLGAVEEVVDACDFVHLMSIASIGSQGHAFDERALSRVEELHAAYPDLMVAVDGGVSEATVEALVRAGANRLLVGSALAESSSPAETYGRIRERAMKGCQPQELVAA